MKGKWLISAALTSCLVAGSAHASVARQAVMGGQPNFYSGSTSAYGTGTAAGVITNAVDGSLWYDDDYNVFYNPAYIMDNKNYAVVQKGLEGGFFKGEMDNFAYGIYLNRGAGDAASIYGGHLQAPGLNQRTGFSGTGTGAAAPLDTQRPIDVFFGGDTGVKWGIHGAWAYNRNQLGATKSPNAAASNEDGEVTNRYWHVDIGAQVMGLEPFAGATVFSKYQNNAEDKNGPADQNLNEYNVGVRYKYEGWTPYVMYKHYRESGKPAGTAASVQARTNIIGVGFGHDTKVADGVHIYKNIAYWQSSVEDTTTTTETDRDFKDQFVPIDVAIEADATSWLTLRAGASMNLFANRKTQRTTADNATNLEGKSVSLTTTNGAAPSFRVGSTFKFGKLHVDSAFGTGNAGGANLDTTDAGFDSQTFALLSASYHW